MSQIPYNLLRIGAVSFLAFVIYGSLVPLEYVAISFDQAITRFTQIPFLDLGIGSRADWVANFLLFIPLGFLLTGSFWPARASSRWFLMVLVGLFGCLLSLGIEFTQLYFPQRTVSQNDILAETIGGLVGITIWWKWGEPFSRYYLSVQEARGVVNLAGKILYLYLFILVAYNLLPLDLTISPVEMYHKWKSGGVNFLPFSTYKGSLAEIGYEIISDILLWSPVSLLYRFSGKSLKTSLNRTIGIAFVLEFLQFFVYSRLSDVSDLITAAIGAWIGLYIAVKLLSKKSTQGSAAAVGHSALAGLNYVPYQVVGTIGSLGLLMVIFWYPFEFNLDPEFIKERASFFFTTPLKAYYFGSEYRAITELFHKVVFFIPIAVFVAWLRDTAKWPLIKALPNWAILALLLLLPFTIELGQIFIEHKSAQITDVFFEWVGCYLGFKGYFFVSSRMHTDDLDAEQPPVRSEAQHPADAIEPELPDRAPVVDKVKSRATTQPVFSPAMAISALVWLMLILLFPLLGSFIQPASAESLFFLASWIDADNVFPVYWALGMTAAILIAVGGCRARKMKTSAAVLIWIFSLALSATLPIFLTPVSLLPILTVSFAGLMVAVVAIKFFRRLTLPDDFLFNISIVFIVLLLPFNLGADLFNGPLGGEWLAVGERLYFLLKSFILFLPLGFIAALIGKSSFYLGMSRCFLISFIAVCGPLILLAPGVAILNILALPLGISIGAWLGQNHGHRYA
jgi:glycopeptide antibiotics resistance protein